MNLIGLDISITSTAMSIESNGIIKLFNYTTHKSNIVWIKSVQDLITFRFIQYKKIEDYSDYEMYKLQEYDSITNLILSDILNNIDKSKPTKVNIEGYSYSSNTNSIIDIVCYSTLLRQKIYNHVSKDIHIIPPKTVKIQTSVKVYGYQPAPIGKNGKTLKDPMVTCNNDGVKGGDFEKKDMLNAMLDGNYYNPIYDYVKENKDSLLSLKTMPKPFDDVIDSILIMKL